MNTRSTAPEDATSEGVWQVYITQPGGRRLLDGEATDGKRAWRLYDAALATEQHGTHVELVSPRGQVVAASVA